MEPQTQAEVRQPRGTGGRLPALLLRWLAVGYGVVLLSMLAGRISAERIPFDTDEADHACAAIEVYTAVARADAAQIYRSIVRQAFYAPVHSFVVAASYAIAGPSLASSRMPNVVLLGVFAALLTVATHRAIRRVMPATSPPWVSVGASAALSLALSSPMMVVNAVLCMLEMTGCVIVTLILLVLIRLETGGCDGMARSRLAVLGVLFVFVTLTKYNFGLILFPAAVAGFLSGPGGVKAAARRLIDLAWLLPVFVVPLVAWFLIADRYPALYFFTVPREFVPLWSFQNLTYYPGALVTKYALNPVVGVVVLALAALAAVRHWRSLTARVATWSVLIALFVMTASRTPVERHIMIVMPGFWLLAGLGLVTLVSLLAERRPAIAFLPGACVLGFFLLVSVSLAARVRSFPGEITREMEGEPAFSDMLDFIAGHVDLHRPLLLIGVFDQFGPELVSWDIARRTGALYTEVRVDDYPFIPWREEYKRGWNKNLDRPYVDPSFPREPLEAVARTRYYAYAVDILRSDRPVDAQAAGPGASVRFVQRRAGEWLPAENPLGKGNVLRSRLAAVRSFGFWHLFVYDLRSAGAKP
ncbi:MAG: hypothetical protein V1873_07575 [Verrucomicrobiota bacterium]